MMKRILFLAIAVAIPILAFAQGLRIKNDNVIIDTLRNGAIALSTNDEYDITMSTDVSGDAHKAWLDGTTGDFEVSSGHLDLQTTGKTLILEDGTAASACIGTGTLTAATADTVATTCIETGDYVFIMRTSADTDGAGQEYVDNIVDGTSFDVTSVTADTATYHWVIIKGQ
jgi:hypothetical protein